MFMMLHVVRVRETQFRWKKAAYDGTVSTAAVNVLNWTLRVEEEEIWGIGVTASMVPATAFPLHSHSTNSTPFSRHPLRRLHAVLVFVCQENDAQLAQQSILQFILQVESQSTTQANNCLGEELIFEAGNYILQH